MSIATRLREDQDGYTLTELLVGLTISLLVIGAGAMVVTMAVTTQPQTTERAGQIQQGRVMIENLTRELRQGESVLSASNSGLELLTYVPVATCGGSGGGPAQLCRVSYTCGSSSCARTEMGSTGAGASSTTTVVSGVTGPNVFFPGQTPPADPTYVGVRLVYPQESGEEAVTIDDGAALRNHFDANGGT